MEFQNISDFAWRKREKTTIRMTNTFVTQLCTTITPTDSSSKWVRSFSDDDGAIECHAMVISLVDSPFASLPTLCRRFTLIELLGVSSSGIEVWKAMDLHLTKDVTLKVSADTHMITYDYKALAVYAGATAASPPSSPTRWPSKSRNASNTLKEMDASSVLYAAPETFNCLEALGNTVTCDATDVWALGVLYFVMLYGHHPLAPGLVVLDDAMKLPFVEHLRKYDGTVVFPATPVVPPIVQVRVLLEVLKC
ncbi:hypothetical protein DYB36_007403 [Aphanomyces astaci]|uniref:Protein kinase domain-containing protein n=3 Tax=Aphanomyces astaci TaxID=112090 RepID=A0A397B2Q4_APHAT|nr:hypothetical protein DYB36_007403 [Aphanomyces astaci]